MAQAATRNRTTPRQETPKQAPTDNLPAKTQEQTPPRQSHHPLVEFAAYMDARMNTLMESLPPHIDPKRFVGVVKTALQNKPSLLTCTFPSLWNACIRAAQDGLLPDGREGAIAPYGENVNGKRAAEIATWMPMIEGYRKKAREAGVLDWNVQIVREKDHFRFAMGDAPFIEHEPYFGVDEPGAVVGAYSIARLPDGSLSREVMPLRDISAVRSKSKATNGPWNDPAFYPEMCRKTVARRHYKQLPHSEAMDRMIQHDDNEFGLSAQPERTVEHTPVRRLASDAAAFDAYAGTGETIDGNTGEVLDDDFGGGDEMRADHGNTQQDPKDDPISTGNRVRGSSAKAAAADKVMERDGSVSKDRGDGEASKVLDKREPDSDFPGDKPMGQSEEGGAQDDAQQQDDGADRPWPPGSDPTNEAEYRRYLATKLASYTKETSGQIAPWFRSENETQLRKECGVNANPLFSEMQKIAIDRRTFLAQS